MAALAMLVLITLAGADPMAAQTPPEAPGGLPWDALSVVFDDAFLGWLDEIWVAHQSGDAAALWAAAGENLPRMEQWVATHQDALPEDDRYCELEAAGIGQDRPVNDATMAAAGVELFSGRYGNLGGVCITGTGSGAYTSTGFSHGAMAAVFIDLGGDDRYLSGSNSFGTWGGLFLDLGGQDVYESGGLSFGYLGGLFIDASGNDRYTANGNGAFAQDATFIDGGGSDRYESRGNAFAYGTLAPATFLDLGGDDTYETTGLNHFGVGSPLFPAVSTFIDVHGDDHYVASGDYGFGFRGGYAMDLSGNDTYDARGASSSLFGASPPNIFVVYSAAFLDAGGQDVYLHGDPGESFGSTPLDGSAGPAAFLDLDGAGGHNGRFRSSGEELAMPASLGDALRDAGVPADLAKAVHAGVYGNEQPVAAFAWSPDPATDLDEIVFQDTSSDEDGLIDRWSWDFGDGTTSTEQDPRHRFADDGSYTVELTVTDDVGATAKHQETIEVANVAPSLRIDHDAPNDPDTSTDIRFFSVADDPDGQIVQYAWDFGDGVTSSQTGPTHRFDDGAYTVTLAVTDDDGAQTIASTNLTIANVLPSVSIDVAGGPWQSQDTVTFQAAAEDPDGSIADVRWHIAGTEYAGQTVQHAFDTHGAHAVRVVVEDDDGGIAEATLDITIQNAAPLAAFSHAPAPASTADVVQFTDLSVDIDGGIVAWHWDFGDATSQASQPGHQFATRGDHPVTLTVTDEAGAQASHTAWVAVANHPPIASFTVAPDDLRQNEDIHLSSTSLDPDGTIASLHWTLPDGSTSSEPGIVLNLDPGTHTVTLEVTDDDGATSSAQHTLTLGNLAPLAGFSLQRSDVLRSEAVHVSVAVSDPDGEVATWALDWGDGTGVEDPGGTTLQHAYTQAGLYRIVLTATDDDGETTTKQRHVRVEPVPPEAAFTAPEAVPTGEPVTFHDLSTDDVGIASWRWDFGDGTGSTEQSPRHTYDRPGQHAVRLRVVDAEGAAAEAARDITVLNRAPSLGAIAAPESADVSQVVTFGVDASDPDGDVTLHWDFGDGRQATGQVVSHAFEERGTFRVVATATDDAGAATSTEHLIQVGNRPPVVTIHVPDAPSADAPVALRAETEDPDGDSVDIVWRINGSQMRGAHAAHTLGPGEHDVEVVVTDEHGAQTVEHATFVVSAPEPAKEDLREDAAAKESPGPPMLVVVAALALLAWRRR